MEEVSGVVQNLKIKQNTDFTVVDGQRAVASRCSRKCFLERGQRWASS